MQQLPVQWSEVKAWVFDLDGTLLDSRPDILAAASATLVDYGHAALPLGYQLPNLHGMAGELVRDVFVERGYPAPTDLVRLRAEFEAHYAAQNPSQARLYDGVPEWLHWARNQGVALGVCTNKLERLARDGMQQLDIAAGFGAITGSDTYGVGKPSPEPLLRTLEELGVAPADAVFFGDTHADAACAQAAGVRFAWHSTGYGDARVQALPQVLRYGRYAELQRQVDAAHAAAPV
ncbi:HAD family hydrolase [Comamonas sp. GB3 AK4-5]|uniref:HAD family hydrolase n=1 Tax=Comamonas sp. GB3 AK4-5 TaxID=3231487 RepID=UPI00351EDE6C